MKNKKNRRARNGSLKNVPALPDQRAHAFAILNLGQVPPMLEHLARLEEDGLALILRGDGLAQAVHRSPEAWADKEVQDALLAHITKLSQAQGLRESLQRGLRPPLPLAFSDLANKSLRIALDLPKASEIDLVEMLRDFLPLVQKDVAIRYFKRIRSDERLLDLFNEINLLTNAGERTANSVYARFYLFFLKRYRGKLYALGLTKTFAEFWSAHVARKADAGEIRTRVARRILRRLQVLKERCEEDPFV